MHIRKAIEGDIHQLALLKKPKSQGYRKKFEENQLKRLQEMKEEKAVYLVGEENNAILGHVFIKFYGSQTEPNYPNMQDLYVDEEKRNKGIGTQLIHAAKILPKKMDIPRLVLQ